MRRPFSTNENVLKIALGQIVSQFGDRLNILACLAALYAIKAGSTRETTVLWIMVFAPWLVFGPIAGVFVDRWDHKRTLITCDLLRAALVLLIPLSLLAYHVTFWYLYILVFLVNLVSRFFNPARLAIVPRIVDERDLLRANSILTTAGLLGVILGLALGDFAVEAFSRHDRLYLAFVIDSLTYIVSASAIAFVVYPIMRRTDARRPQVTPLVAMNGGNVNNIYAQLWEGLRYSIRNKPVLFAILSQSLMMFGGGALVNLVNPMVRDQFKNIILAPFGMLLTAFALGAGVGAFLVGVLAERRSRRGIIIGGFVLNSLSIALFPLLFAYGGGLGALPQLGLVLVLAFLMGLFVSPVMISCDTLLQESAAKVILGRVFAAREAAMAFAAICGVGISGLLDFLLGPAYRNLLLLGIGLFLALMAALWSGWMRRRPISADVTPLD